MVKSVRRRGSRRDSRKTTRKNVRIRTKRIETRNQRINRLNRSRKKRKRKNTLLNKKKRRVSRRNYRKTFGGAPGKKSGKKMKRKDKKVYPEPQRGRSEAAAQRGWSEAAANTKLEFLAAQSSREEERQQVQVLKLDPRIVAENEGVAKQMTEKAVAKAEKKARMKAAALEATRRAQLPPGVVPDSSDSDSQRELSTAELAREAYKRDAERFEKSEEYQSQKYGEKLAKSGRKKVGDVVGVMAAEQAFRGERDKASQVLQDSPIVREAARTLSDNAKPINEAVWEYLQYINKTLIYSREKVRLAKVNYFRRETTEKRDTVFDLREQMDSLHDKYVVLESKLEDREGNIFLIEYRDVAEPVCSREQLEKLYQFHYNDNMSSLLGRFKEEQLSQLYDDWKREKRILVAQEKMKSQYDKPKSHKDFLPFGFQFKPYLELFSVYDREYEKAVTMFGQEFSPGVDTINCFDFMRSLFDLSRIHCSNGLEQTPLFVISHPKYHQYTEVANGLNAIHDLFGFEYNRDTKHLPYQTVNKKYGLVFEEPMNEEKREESKLHNSFSRHENGESSSTTFAEFVTHPLPPGDSSLEPPTLTVSFEGLNKIVKDNSLEFTEERSILRKLLKYETDNTSLTCYDWSVHLEVNEARMETAFNTFEPWECNSQRYKSVFGRHRHSVIEETTLGDFLARAHHLRRACPENLSPVLRYIGYKTFRFPRGTRPAGTEDGDIFQVFEIVPGSRMLLINWRKYMDDYTHIASKNPGLEWPQTEMAYLFSEIEQGRKVLLSPEIIPTVSQNLGEDSRSRLQRWKSAVKAVSPPSLFGLEPEPEPDQDEPPLPPPRLNSSTITSTLNSDSDSDSD